ncbi:MAG: hypothetical protein H6Q02_543 [Acidobacteria bacterium]|jgi:hypothetical protein|nr:hypothetical protein [Acidobacteriota bacterium]
MPFCPTCGVEYREGFTRCSDCDTALVAEPPATPAAPGPEWVPVASFVTAEEAGLARGLLAGVGIAAAVVDRHVVELPVPQVDAAVVVLLVPPDQVEAAATVLDRAEAGEVMLPEEDLEVEKAGEEEPS